MVDDSGKPVQSGSALPHWEMWAWCLLVVVALGLRLFDLGDRLMSHDESLHTYYSWVLGESMSPIEEPIEGHPGETRKVIRLDYRHDPMMHGPLLFHMNALVYATMGANDFTSRIVPALFGTACVAALFLYRRWLGVAGAMAAAALVCVNPAILYHSRYIRNDIYICLFTLVMMWGTLRFRETGKLRYAIAVSLGMAFSLVSKEVAFMHGALLGLFCLGDAIVQAVREREPGQNVWRTFRDCLATPGFGIAFLLLTLVIPYLAAPFYAAADHFLDLPAWDPVDTRKPLDEQNEANQELSRGFVTGLFVFTLVASVLYYLLRGPTRRKISLEPVGWLTAFVSAMFVQLFFFTTMFAEPAHGISSGFVGSLGYWLAQQEVKRGSSDSLFYIGLILVYEVVLWVLATASIWKGALRGPLLALFVAWGPGALLAYSIAGEKMSWLMTHISLPLCLMAGPALADWVQSWNRTRAWALLAWCALLLPLLFAAAGQPRGMVVSGAIVAVPIIGWCLWNVRSLRAVFSAFITILLVQYTVNSFRLSGPNQHYPTEPMVYAHGGPPAVKTHLRHVRRHLEENPGTIAAIYNDYAWPLFWYFKDGGASFPVGEVPIPDDASAAILPEHVFGNFTEEVRAEWTVIDRTTNVWWPLQTWHHVPRLATANLDDLPDEEHETAKREFRDNYTWDQKLADLFPLFVSSEHHDAAEHRTRFIQFYVFRNYPGRDLRTWDLRSDFLLVTRDMPRHEEPIP